MPEPIVTIIIPCHNHAKWVNEAVDSAASQDYPFKRIVVVDDGSTDGSADLVLKRLYKPRGPEVQGEPFAAAGKLTTWDTQVMIQRFKSSHGPSFARNWGMKVGWDGTDIFAFLDSDDTFSGGKITKSVAKFTEGVGAVYSDYDTLNDAGLRLRQFKEPFSRQRLVRECIVNCDSLVSKQAIFECGGFDESLRCCEDFDLWLRVSEKFLIYHLAESLVTVRVGTHSSSATVDKSVWNACYSRVFAKMQERLQGPQPGR